MNCNLMGLQGSGFNETALVKFKVTDGTGAGVSGVRVDFTLMNAPAGTSVDPDGTTNAMGEVRANVRAGTTVGSFSVTGHRVDHLHRDQPHHRRAWRQGVEPRLHPALRPGQPPGLRGRHPAPAPHRQLHRWA